MMSHPNSQLVISLSPDKLCMARVRRRKVIQAEQIELDPKEWNDVWEDGLVGLDQPLRQLLLRFPSKKHPPATLVYHSQTVTQQVHMFAQGASSPQAESIAKIREVVGLREPVESCTFSHSGKDADSVATLVYSDREEHLRSLYAWLNRCGIVVQSMVPASVAAMSTTAQQALNAPQDTAVFYIGTDVSVLAYATDSGIHLIRSIGIGYQKLVEGYMQALRSSGQANAEVQEDKSQDDFSDAYHSDTSAHAVELLFEHGIPIGQIEADGIELQSTVMPALAPVLQRFCIEIKQTFRFSLSGASLPRNLVVSGPGAAVPHISKVLSQHIDMHIRLDPAVESFMPVLAFGQGTLEHTMVTTGAFPPGLLPEIAHDVNTRKFLMRSLGVGAAMAAIALGGEYAKTSVRCQQIDYLMGNNMPKVNAVNAFHDQRRLAFEMASAISDMSALVSDNIQSVPQWHDLLAQLAELSPEAIRMHELRGTATNGVPVLEISGLAAAGSDRQSSVALNEFVNALESAEGVDRVTLGATSRISVGEDQWARQFRLNVELNQSPFPYQEIVHADESAGTWGTP